MAKFSLPKNTQRTSVIGRTGSGKTQFAAWLLSHMNFDKQPWVIIDYKHDALLNEIEGVKEISFTQIPKKPGLYIIHPTPGQDDEIEEFLWQLWARGNIGIYIDEAYMIDKYSKAYNALLTQGRSKKIPMINLTQRPTNCSRFVFSESDFFCIFHLNDERDRKTVQAFLPNSVAMRLKDYHSYWYDVGKDSLFILQPVPTRDIILERFNEKLKPKRSFF